MKKLLCAAMAGMLVLSVMSMSAYAQRNATAKARGEYGIGFWNSPQRSATRYYNYRYTPMYSAVEQNRSFSYEPIGIHAGDKVMVDHNDVKLMDGRRVVTTVDQGQEFEVGKVTNGWLRAEFQHDGKQQVGWIWHKNVKLEAGPN